MTSDEKRRHPRIDLMAQVQVTRDTEVYLMPAHDISKGGIFIQGDKDAYPDLAVKRSVELLIFLADNIGVDLACSAKVVRYDKGNPPSRPAGFGLTFQGLDATDAAKLEALIQHARGRTPGNVTPLRRQPPRPVFGRNDPEDGA